MVSLFTAKVFVSTPEDTGPAPPRHARPRGRSHYTLAFHTTHTTSVLKRSPHLEGIILAKSPRRDQRAGGRRTRRTPPYTLADTQGTNAARLQCRQSQSSSHSYTLSKSASAPVEGGRVGNQWAAAQLICSPPVTHDERSSGALQEALFRSPRARSARRPCSHADRRRRQRRWSGGSTIRVGPSRVPRV